MITIHQSCSWPANQKKLGKDILAIELLSTSVWTIQRSEARVAIMFFEYLLNTFLHKVFEEAELKCKDLPAGHAFMFNVNWSKLFATKLKACEFGAGYKLAEDMMKRNDGVIRTEKLTQVPATEQKKIYDSTVAYMTAVTITALPPALPSLIFSTENSHFYYRQQLIFQAYETMNARLLNHRQNLFVLTSDDKVFLGQNIEWVTEKLDCTGYVFLTLREREALDWIRAGLQGRENNMAKSFYQGKAITLSQSMNYRIINTPDDGDLIVYFHANTKKPTHTGIYRDNGLIESKLGIDQSNITMHPIENVTLAFGSHVLFFRKSPNITPAAEESKQSSVVINRQPRSAI